MARIIPLHSDPHQEVQKLLPWYANGTLERAEQTRVETHLRDCAECRSELALERRLAPEVAGLSISADAGWAALRKRVDPQMSRRVRATAAIASGWRRLGRWGLNVWVLAGQGAIALAVIAVVATQPHPAPASHRAPSYHALGDARAAPAGNVIVIFRPSAREAQLRHTLKAVGARVVDGPTAADAYVLAVPDARRAAALVTLRAQSDVILAEAIDNGDSR